MAVTEFNISPANYHVVNEDGWQSLRGSEPFAGGSYSMQDQAVFVRSRRTEDLVRFAFVAHHETLHFKSHQVLQRLYPGKDVLPYRWGFEIVTRHGHRTYFRKLDEAVIQELTNRFVQEQLTQYPATKDALAASETRRQLLRKHVARLNEDDQQALASAVYTGELPPGVADVFSQYAPEPKALQRAFDNCRYGGALTSAYVPEVQALNHLMDELHDQNRDDFKNRDEVFDSLQRL